MDLWEVALSQILSGSGLKWCSELLLLSPADEKGAELDCFLHRVTLMLQLLTPLLCDILPLISTLNRVTDQPNSGISSRSVVLV